METIVNRAVQAHLHAVNSLQLLSPRIAALGDALVRTLQSGGKLLVFGNGGSAGDAQHIAAELVGRFVTERRGLPALALTTDTSALTAIANDYGYEHVFARQVEALARPGDLALGISTSGNSANVLRALEAARHHGCETFGLSGRDGGQMNALLGEHNIVIPVQETARVQECHILIGHIICEMVDGALT
jgi:D-sedoheptulose 7-phosphate isomerase